MTDASFRHPEITAARLIEWERSRASSMGEAYIKSRGETFLPKPSGFSAMDDGGVAAYNAYTNRAQFPEMFEPTVSAMVGMIHDKGIKVELPDAMADIKAETNIGSVTLDIPEFHRIITRGLLTLGRYGVLAEAPTGGGDVYLIGHEGDRVINWDAGFYVIDESKQVRNGFQWDLSLRYRVLELTPEGYRQALWVAGGNNSDLTQAQGFPASVTATGGAALTEVPFYVGNARQMTPQVESPPLIGVAGSAIANYQLSADYRHQLFMSGQETLVVINGEKPSFVGAGSVHEMLGSEGLTPDMKYVGPSCIGIDKHKEAMAENRLQAAIAGARLLMGESSGNAQESGHARKLRFSSETASILTVARSSCMILQSALRAAATMQNLNPDDVAVTPPTDLMDKTLEAKDLKTLFEIYSEGGMSFESYFAAAQRGGWQPEELEAVEEMGRIEDPRFGVDDAPDQSEQSDTETQPS